MKPASDILTLFTSLSLLIFLIICPSKLTSHRARNPPRAFVSLSIPLSLFPSDQSRSLCTSAPIDDDRSICAMTWKLSLGFFSWATSNNVSSIFCACWRWYSSFYGKKRSFMLSATVEGWGKTWINSLVEQLISFRAPHSHCLWFIV